jgi:hypothetical protein
MLRSRPARAFAPAVLPLDARAVPGEVFPTAPLDVPEMQTTPPPAPTTPPTTTDVILATLQGIYDGAKATLFPVY